MYSVYVIKSETSGRIYIGQTKDIRKRLKQHNNISFDKRSFTKLSGRKWNLIHLEIYKTRKEAIWREKCLKSHKGRDCLRNHVLGP